MTASQFTEEINNELETCPLAAIDKFIVNSGNILVKEYDDKQLLFLFCKCITEHLKLSINDENYIDQLFKDNIGVINQEFISICFLRLFNNNIKIISNYKLKILNLFDKYLKEVYRNRNILDKDQSFEKENKLQDYVPNMERTIFNILNDITTLKEFNDQRFRSTLHKNDYKRIIRPFLPHNFEKEIDNIFKKIKNYTEANIYEKADLVEALTNELENFIKISTDFNTNYSENFLVKPLGKSHKILIEDIAKNPINKSATLVLKRTDKKYPFTGNKNSFNLSSLLIKEGEGYAYNTKIEILETSNGLLIDKKVQTLGKVITDQRVDFVSVTTSREEYVIVTVKISWSNYNKTTEEKSFDLSYIAKI